MIVLGLLGSAIMAISRGVGDLLWEVCLLFGVRSDPGSTAGGVVRVRSGTTPPILRWWLDHGPYLADGPLESSDSEAHLKTCDGEEVTVLQDPKESSGGYILDASPASEVYETCLVRNPVSLGDGWDGGNRGTSGEGTGAFP
ncbi:hypothetical protein L873DRAFT_1789420 [Choiromyces venosus 120613-1]|uniref:Uncharacterized protein n=1 Tax=Choiromyces venosus 120613-1 TaxID=1336337 RepID=A0A3N4JRX2_9PEZI|nr:hypothetical protein L873DRAFT_1789420 [Choiromyces venosus 120613-1]